MAAGGAAVGATAAAAAAVCSESHIRAAGPGHPHSACPHPAPLTTGPERQTQTRTGAISVSVYSLTIIHSPWKGGGRRGYDRMGWEGRRHPLPRPSPLCASGGKGGRGLPLTPPECKQQQMNKNKNTKGRRKFLDIPPPQGLPCHQRRSLAAPSTKAASVLGAAQCRPHPRGAESRAQNCCASSSHR